MKLWLVGKYLSGPPGAVVWAFQGIFDSAAAATAACTERGYFMATVELNEVLADEPVPFPDFSYPLAGEAE